jgi:hypothetical protein
MLRLSTEVPRGGPANYQMAKACQKKISDFFATETRADAGQEIRQNGLRDVVC